jgi:hypothetical protein
VVTVMTTPMQCGLMGAGQNRQTRGESLGDGTAGHPGHPYRVLSRPSRSLPLFRGTFAGHLSRLSRLSRLRLITTISPVEPTARARWDVTSSRGTPPPCSLPTAPHQSTSDTRRDR